MTTSVRIRIVVTTLVPEAEFIAGEVSLTSFAPDLLDRELDQLFREAATSLNRKGVNMVDLGSVEVSVQLSSSGGSVRPSLHISSGVVALLKTWGASVDFDPYCD
jgi:hypothetical protein